MKWLTPEWARGQLSDKEARDATKAYQARLTELAHAATGPVSDLAKSVDHRLDMSDGIIDSIEIDQPNRLSSTFGAGQPAARIWAAGACGA